MSDEARQATHVRQARAEAAMQSFVVWWYSHVGATPLPSYRMMARQCASDVHQDLCDITDHYDPTPELLDAALTRFVGGLDSAGVRVVPGGNLKLRRLASANGTLWQVSPAPR